MSFKTILIVSSSHFSCCILSIQGNLVKYLIELKIINFDVNIYFIETIQMNITPSVKRLT